MFSVAEITFLTAGRFFLSDDQKVKNGSTVKNVIYVTEECIIRHGLKPWLKLKRRSRISSLRTLDKMNPKKWKVFSSLDRGSESLIVTLIKTFLLSMTSMLMEGVADDSGYVMWHLPFVLLGQSSVLTISYSSFVDWTDTRPHVL